MSRKLSGTVDLAEREALTVLPRLLERRPQAFSPPRPRLLYPPSKWASRRLILGLFAGGVEGRRSMV